MNIFSTIGEQAEKVLEVLKLSLDIVRDRRATREEMSKRAILNCFLYYECGYNYSEIAFYTHKEPSTIRYSIKTYTKIWEENRTTLLDKIKENI